MENKYLLIALEDNFFVKNAIKFNYENTKEKIKLDLLSPIKLKSRFINKNIVLNENFNLDNIEIDLIEYNKIIVLQHNYSSKFFKNIFFMLERSSIDSYFIMFKNFNIVKKYINNYKEKNRYLCPICNESFFDFLPAGEKIKILTKYEIIGGGYRKNCVCPNCLSTDRERLIFLYLTKKTQYIAGKYNILHIAPERNILQLFLKSDNNYIMGDLNPNYNTIRKINILKTNFQNNSFHLIICNHVLEHIVDDIKAMKELYRILSPKGIAILQVPISFKIENTIEDENITLPEERELIFGQKDHVRIYGKDYIERLETAGFEVEVWDFNEELKDEKLSMYNLNKIEKIYICKKNNF